MAGYEKPRALVKDSNDSLLKEIRDAYSYDSSEWKPIHDEGKKDMRYVAGDPWEQTDREAREKAGRPCLAVDELNQYFNQTINGVRARQRAVKFAPVGNGANEDGAEFYADKMREIEYRSKAQIAYVTAFENAVHRGYGFVRVNTKYSTTPGQRFNQDIWIEAIPNPDLVLPDADAKMPDSSDMKRLTYIEEWPKQEFLDTYGEKVATKAFGAEHVKEAPAWIKENSVMVGEYWKVKTKERTLLLVQRGPETLDIWEDEYRAMTGDQIIKKRKAEDRSVCQYLANGIEVFDEKPWAGKYIPFVSCYGKVIYLDAGGGAKRTILSMTRLARDPYMSYCWAVTGACEAAASTTKNPYWAYEGQLDQTQVNAVAKSVHEPVAVLLAKHRTEDMPPGTILPLPERNSLAPDLGGWAVMMEFLRRTIQSAMATNFMPTQAQRKNEKSGKALDKIDEVSQRGSFHFNDHYDDMITHTGVMVEDLMDKIHDTEREVGIRKTDDTSKVVRINTQAPVNDSDGKPYQISTKGSYQVTVSTGPAFDSTREQESEFADVLMETPFAPMIADLAIKLKGGGPVMDEIAERLTPPQFKKQKDGQPDPQQLMQALQKMQAEHENLKQVATELAMDLKTQKFKVESDTQIAMAKIASAERIAASKDSTAIVRDEMKLNAQASIEAAENQLRAIEDALDLQQGELSRHHEVGMAQMGHQQTLEQGEQGHRQKLEQGAQGLKGDLVKGEQSNVHSLEQGQQGHVQAIEQIKAAPKPTNGSGA